MDRVVPEERLLNLFIALTSTRARMTKQQIRSTVYGYDQRMQGEDTKADAAFERMFERDKEDLRRLGVPLQTVVDAANGGDIGYRIDPSAATMQPINLDAAELAVVNLAVDYWRDAALGTDARQAVTKVASRIQHEAVPELPFGARATGARAALGTLAEALHERRSVKFEYASSSSAPAVRTVDPWRILVVNGTEYLVGRDHGADASRTFRLSRILGTVKAVGDAGAYEPPHDIPLGSLTPGAVVGTATVALRPEAGHALRLAGTVTGADGEWDLVEVPYRHLDAIRADVLALAGAARAVAPQQLVDDVRRYASAALEATHE
ncbi:helix-turn-helix transcriptional regulator [Demequina sp.]|uniref:helix-turn-helix transcriptional regulator n=1 Tax=Demequina sp. TaxID=2050685 RepID=UPI003D0AF463